MSLLRRVLMTVSMLIFAGVTFVGVASADSGSVFEEASVPGAIVGGVVLLGLLGVAVLVNREPKSGR